MRTNEKIKAFYEAMMAAYGPQGWWPAGTAFEMVVGAILTQNTSWKNVERAIANLKAEGLLDAAALHAAPVEHLAEVIRPAGYFNVKARRLRNFIDMLVGDFGGDLDALFALRTAALRETILGGLGHRPRDGRLDRPLRGPQARLRGRCLHGPHLLSPRPD